MREIILFLLAVVSAQKAFAISSDSFEYLGYMRTGVGTNLKGGDQNCYYQTLTPGDQFRLGNECSIYGESMFRAYTPTAKQATGEFFRANLGLAYNPDGRRSGEPPNFYIFGAYIEAGRLDGSNSVIWVGRRYYRDTDIHIDDFFYFADIEGSGAGIEQIPLWNGYFSVAVFMEDADHKDQITNGGVTQTVPVQTENGVARTILLDVRLFDTKIADHDRLNFWTGYAGSTGGTDIYTNQQISDASGFVAAVKHTHDLDQGYQKFSVLYGAGLMQGLNLGGTFGTDPTQTLNQPYFQGSHRLRVVEDMMWQRSANFAVASALIYENWAIGNSNGNNGRWFSAGFRPIYFFNQHYSLAFDGGAASVKQSGESGNGHPMYRMTIAPQISPKAEFYARPVLRAYLTKTWAQGAPTAFVATSTAVGFQGEVWF